MADIVIPFYYDLIANEQKLTSSITGIGETYRANLDFEINVPVPINLFNSI